MADLPGPVVVVQPYDIHLMVATGLGLPVVALVDSDARRTETGRRLSETIPTLVADLDDPHTVEAVLESAHRTYGAYRLVQFCDERRMVTIARAARRAGLVTEGPEAYRALNDKERFLEVASGVGAISRAWCAASFRDTMTTVRTSGGPWVLKPSDGSGSRGLVFARGWEQVRAMTDGEHWVLEQYLQGREYSIETLSVDGEHYVFGVTAKTTTGPPRFVERAHVFPATLDPGLERRMERLVRAFLNAAGYRNGPAHTEAIVHAGGIDLVESQARLGGDRIPTLVARATGIDPEVELHRSLLGGWRPPQARTSRRAGIRYVDLPYGTLLTPVDLTPGSASDGMEVQPVAPPGGPLREATSSSERHVGLIMDTAPDATPLASTRPLRAAVQISDRAPTLVLFGATDEQISQCVALGHVVVLVQAHDQLTEHQASAAAVVVLCDIGSRAAVDRAAELLAPYSHLPFVSVRQYGVLFRALVCDRLGLTPLSPLRCSETVSDKIALRRHLDELRFPAPSWAVASARDDVRRFCISHGGQGVLKTSRGTGGVGVRRVTADDEVDLFALRARVDDVLPDGVAAADFLIEEHLDGPLISLESVWVHGRHVLLGVTTSEVSMTSSAELRHTFPGSLAPDVLDQATRQVEGLFGSLGMYAGGTHVEFIVVHGVPTMIDAHDRPGGGHIPELVELALGHSSTFLAIAAQTGALEPEAFAASGPALSACVRFVTLERSIPAPDRSLLRSLRAEVASKPGIRHVHIDDGAEDLPAEVDNWTRPGYVIAVADTPAAAEARAEAAHGRIAAALTGGVNRRFAPDSECVKGRPTQ